MRKYLLLLVALFVIPSVLPSVAFAVQLPVAEYGNNPAELSVPPGQLTTEYITIHFTKNWTTGSLLETWTSRRGVHTISGPSSSVTSWTWSSAWTSVVHGSFSSSETVIIAVIGDNSGGTDDLLIYEYFDVNGLVETPSLGRVGMLILLLVLGILGVLFLRRQLVHRRAVS